MKIRALLLALAPVLLLPDLCAVEAPPSSLAAESHVIVDQIRAKAKAGRPTAASLAPDLAAVDALLAKHPEKTEDTAQVVLMKASVFWQVLYDEETAKKLFTAIVADYAGTKAAVTAAAVLKVWKPGAQARAAARAASRKTEVEKIIGHAAPELHFKWSSKAGLTSLSSLKGKVVVLDFWATWCGPCIASFPQIREHVAHFKGMPVVFLGVTSIQGFVANLEPQKIDTKGDPAKEIGLMPAFMKATTMTWDVAIGEEDVFNPDYHINGIPFVVIIAPDGTVRHTGLHPGQEQADIGDKINALLQEFHLPSPATGS